MRYCASTFTVGRRPGLATLVLGVSLALGPSSTALGAVPDQSPSPTIVETETLRPADNRRHGEIMRMTHYSDGSTEIHGTKMIEAGAAGTKYTMDLESGTYRETAAGREATKRSGVGSVEQAGTVSAAALASRRVHIRISDPVFAVVAQNYNELWWGFDFTKVWPNALAEWCSASNPTQFGTHWFTLSCNDGRGAWVWNGNRITNVSKGLYNNWDFADDAIETRCEASSTITGHQDGNADVSWSSRCWGEFSWLLGATVDIS